MSLIRWTAGFLRPYRARVAGIVALSVAEAGLALLAPWALKLIVDHVLAGQPLPAALSAAAPALDRLGPAALLFAAASGGFAVQAAGALVRAVHTQWQVDMGQRIVHDLRTRLLDHLQALPLAHHVTHRTADAVYRLDADTWCINDLVTGGALPLALAGLTLSLMFVVLLQIDAALALLALAVVPCLYLCLRHHATTLSVRAEAVKTREAALVGRAFETLRAIAAIKSFARERHEARRFARAGVDTMQARLTLTRQESLFSLAVTTVTLGGTALVIVVGGLHVLDGELSVGSLLVVIAYLAAVYAPVASIAHTIGALQQAVVSAGRVRTVLALRPEPPDAPGAIDAGGITGHVRIEQVGFSYDGRRPVLDDISLEARPGDLVAIVGPTGAGKTTLVHLIPRLFDATAGQVRIDGVDIARYGLRSLREQVALAPQDPVLLSGTIRDNIRYGRLDAPDAEVEAAARAAHAHPFIAALPHGYDTPVAEAGATLSGGERQRLGLARALLKDAPILILDEPTSAVDPITEAAVFEALRRRRAGRTTFVIAHRLTTIRDATRILVLDRGRAAAAGPHEALLASSALYRGMWRRVVGPDAPAAAAPAGAAGAAGSAGAAG